MKNKKTRCLRFFLTAILALPSTAAGLRAQRTTTTASAPETTTTQPSQPIYRYFPWFINGSSQTTGLAAVNLSSVPAELKFTARNDSGATLATAETTLQPGNQIVKLAGELLPALGETTGWLIMESSVAGVEGFFLLFDYDLTVMDGSAVSGDILTDFVLPATEDGDLILVNPSNSSVVSTIQYRSELGLAALPMEVTLPPQGRVSAPIASYRLPGLRSGYLQVTGAGVVPLAVIGKPGWSAVFDAFDLSPASSSGFPRTLYAPQYAVGGGFATVMDFINLEDSNITLNLKLVGDDGAQLGRTGSVVLLPRGSVRISSSSIFGITPDSGPVQGYVEIRSNEGGFAGWVRFTDPEERSFGSALQCVSVGRALTHFSQVAQNDLFFTGFAVLNPNPQTVVTAITVYDSGGTVLATGTRHIPPGGRFADLIPQLVGNLPPLTSGFFDMTSTDPVVSFALFGTNAGDVLSAIPPRTFGVCPASGCPRLENLTISPSKVVGGQNTTGSVRLSSPALAGNAVVNLTNNLPFSTIPPSVTVNAGERTATFPITTSTPPTILVLSIGASYGGHELTTQLTICPPGDCESLESLTISPSKVNGGQRATGTVKLDGPAVGNVVVSLSSNNPNATVPSSVTMSNEIFSGQGAAFFTITTNVPSGVVHSTITASYRGVERTAQLTICPAGGCESLESLTISPSKVNGGQSATGTVKLDRPAVGNVVVSLSSNDPTAIVPSSVTMSNEIFSGQGGAFFTITTKVPSGIVHSTITARSGGIQRTAQLTICPAGGCESLESLTISPSLVNGGQIATGTVRLHGPAVENVVVSLSSNDPTATVPSSVTVNSGEIGQAFLITTSVPSGIVHSTITARSGGIQRTAQLSICPAGGCESLTLGQKYRFHSQAREGTFIRYSNFVAGIAVLSSPLDREEATFWVREGLWDKNARSFESIKLPGHYLRHQNFSLFLHENDGSSLFAKDATFWVVPGFADVNMLSFESFNFSGLFIHASPSSGLLTIDSSSGSRFIREATFRPVRVIDGVHTALDLVDNFQKLSAEFNGVGDGAQVLSGTTYPIAWEARGGACHIQGVARIGDRWVFSHNRCDYLGFLMSGTNGNFDFSEIKYGRHPGGIQAAGDVVAVPIKTEGATVSTAKDIIAFYQIDSQGRSREIDSLDQKHGWESAGLAFHPEEDVYYLTASPNATSHDLSNHPVWRSQKGKSLADNDSWELVGSMKVTGSQEAVQLIFDEKTMRMYLITLIHPNDVVSSRINFEMALTPLDLAKVNRTETVEFKPTLYRDDFPTIVGSPSNIFFIPAFRFGASAYIDSEGKLVMIATERDLPPRFPGDPGPRSTAYFTFR